MTPPPADAPPAQGRPATATAPAHRAPAPRSPAASRYASAQLAPQPAAAARARRLTRNWLERWNLHPLTEDAQLIASELITNALAQVPPATPGLSIIYAIHATPAQIRICTWDIAPGHPAPRHAGPDDETGRGLTLINNLTAGNWGWWPTPHSGGKVTWATLTAPQPPARYIA